MTRILRNMLVIPGTERQRKEIRKQAIKRIRMSPPDRSRHRVSDSSLRGSIIIPRGVTKWRIRWNFLVFVFSILFLIIASAGDKCRQPVPSSTRHVAILWRFPDVMAQILRASRDTNIGRFPGVLDSSMKCVTWNLCSGAWPTIPKRRGPVCACAPISPIRLVPYSDQYRATPRYATGTPRVKERVLPIEEISIVILATRCIRETVGPFVAIVKGGTVQDTLVEETKIIGNKIDVSMNYKQD